MQVLIADDDPTSRAVLKRVLEQLGHGVLVANDGAAAWELFCNRPVDAVISDWVMPEPNGPELCRWIRNRPQRPYKYFILLTGNRTSDANLREAMDAGVDDFLTKPVDPEMVWMRLRVAERIINYSHELHTLNSLLPICSYCKRVRNDSDYWERIETYVRQQTGAEFSHSICPDCYDKVVKPALQRTREERRRRDAGGGEPPCSCPRSVD